MWVIFSPYAHNGCPAYWISAKWQSWIYAITNYKDRQLYCLIPWIDMLNIIFRSSQKVVFAPQSNFFFFSGTDHIVFVLYSLTSNLNVRMLHKDYLGWNMKKDARPLFSREVFLTIHVRIIYIGGIERHIATETLIKRIFCNEFAKKVGWLKLERVHIVSQSAPRRS